MSSDSGLTTVQAEVVNFRDFGGAPSAFGGQVRRGRLYRSGHLASAGPVAVRHLLGLGFALVGDLRYPGERVREVSPWPDALRASVLCHDSEEGGEAPHLALLRSRETDEATVTAFYLDLYTTLPFQPAYADLFARVLQGLAALPAGNSDPVLIHCTAGKDRTGMLVALVQHLLGVAQDNIVAEYVLSHAAPSLMQRLPEIALNFEQRHGVRPTLAVLEKLMEAKAPYLAAAFEAMSARCGSVDGYLRSLGIEETHAAALRERLLAR